MTINILYSFYKIHEHIVKTWLADHPVYMRFLPEPPHALEHDTLVYFHDHSAIKLIYDLCVKFRLEIFYQLIILLVKKINKVNV